MSDKVCIVCGKPSTKLCDFVLGFQIVATLPYPTMGADGPMWTCDAPLCDACTFHAGNIFRCGPKCFHATHPASGHDTVDYCPVHREAKRESAPMFEIDADRLRREAWVEIRRRSIRSVSSHEESTSQ